MYMRSEPGGCPSGATKRALRICGIIECGLGCGVNDSCISRMMKGPEGPQPRDGTAETEVSRTRRAAGVIATGETANITAAEAAAMANSAGGQNEPPREGGARGRDYEIACQRQQNLEMRIRMDVQAEERTRTERAQLERLHLGSGGGMNSSEQRGQPGMFLVRFEKPVPKLNSEASSYFPWSKYITAWTVTNTCDDARKETSDPLYSRAPILSVGWI